MLRCAIPVLLLLTGCGPILSTQSMVSARAALIEAQDKDAQSTAPYDYILGEELYDQAWDAFCHSDYQASQSFAKAAEKSLTQALEGTQLPATTADELPTSEPDPAATSQETSTERWGE